MDSERRLRAQERASRMTVRRTTLEDDSADLGCRGPEALTLVTQLTREGWALSGAPWPTYERAQIPCRFVPGWPT